MAPPPFLPTATFPWVDDHLYSPEREFLIKHRWLDRWIEVDPADRLLRPVREAIELPQATLRLPPVLSVPPPVPSFNQPAIREQNTAASQGESRFHGDRAKLPPLQRSGSLGRREIQRGGVRQRKPMARPSPISGKQPTGTPGHIRPGWSGGPLLTSRPPV